MKKPRRITLVLYGLCAILWTIRVILGAVRAEYDSSPNLFLLNVLTALIWIVAFARWFRKYRSEEDR